MTYELNTCCILCVDLYGCADWVLRMWKGKCLRQNISSISVVKIQSYQWSKQITQSVGFKLVVSKTNIRDMCVGVCMYVRAWTPYGWQCGMFCVLLNVPSWYFIHFDWVLQLISFKLETLIILSMSWTDASCIQRYMKTYVSIHIHFKWNKIK